MRNRTAGCLAVVLIGGSICWTAAQTPTQKPAASAKSQSSPAKATLSKARNRTFECPDAEAKQACKSYEELLKAKDSGLQDDGYVCFRKNQDEFFVVSFGKPHFLTRWDKDQKKMVVDTEYTPSGYGSAHAYKNGIADSSTMPHLNFAGKWHPPIFDGETGTFVSENINFKKQDEEDKDVGISIDDEQVSVLYKYENKLDDTVRYELTIQRSTGRFSETYQKVKQQIPFLENIGYCAYRH